MSVAYGLGVGERAGPRVIHDHAEQVLRPVGGQQLVEGHLEVTVLVGLWGNGTGVEDRLGAEAEQHTGDRSDQSVSAGRVTSVNLLLRQLVVALLDGGGLAVHGHDPEGQLVRFDGLATQGSVDDRANPTPQSVGVESDENVSDRRVRHSAP